MVKASAAHARSERLLAKLSVARGDQRLPSAGHCCSASAGEWSLTFRAAETRRALACSAEMRDLSASATTVRFAGGIGIDDAPLLKID
jgi:hypothetical protein